MRHPDYPALTYKQGEVLVLIKVGYTDREIKEMGISAPVIKKARRYYEENIL